MDLLAEWAAKKGSFFRGKIKFSLTRIIWVGTVFFQSRFSLHIDWLYMTLVSGLWCWCFLLVQEMAELEARRERVKLNVARRCSRLLINFADIIYSFKCLNTIFPGLLHWSLLQTVYDLRAWFMEPKSFEWTKSDVICFICVLASLRNSYPLSV